MSVFDVAAHLLETQGAMSAMKLQKMVYYCQAWALALLGRPLFEEQVQAWTYGPVVYELFVSHRGSYVVAKTEGDPTRCSMDVEVRDLLDRVVGYYGRMSAIQLKDLTHAEAPWHDAREAPEGYPSQAIITQQAMRSFFQTQTPPWIHQDE